jgi:Asp-tRNA(Asn)/Glu-tRNA(Gln) amidotransferase A subunit family amidase
VVQAQKFRRWFRDAVLRLFHEVDAIIAPATPCVAPAIGQKSFVLHGQEVPLRPNIGIYTQPISFIGLPVVAVPVPQPGGMPVAMQVISARWREDVALRIAHELEVRGIARAPQPPE